MPLIHFILFFFFFTEVTHNEDSQNCAMFNRIAYLGAATVSINLIGPR